MAEAQHKPTVLITGAGGRIGRAIAIDLAARGWAVGIHYNRSREGAEETREHIAAAGGDAAIFAADLEQPDATGSLIREAGRQLGPLTCLINNASIFEDDDIRTMSVASWDAHHAVNLRAPLFLAQQFAADLPAGRTGAIINLIDQRVRKLTPHFLSYTISKAALWTATQTLAQSLAPAIRVNAIAPGPTLQSRHQSPAEFEHERKSTLLGRGPEPQEIAAAVRFILDAPSMTGQMIALDGGQHLMWQTPDVTGAAD